MGLLECASAASVLRGRDYYEDKKVKNLTEISDGVFTADVIGTASEPYIVNLELHIRENRPVTVLTLTVNVLFVSI